MPMLNLLTPPTRDIGSLGPTKVNLQAYTEPTEQLPAEEYNEAADSIIAVWNAVVALQDDVTVTWQPDGFTQGSIYGSITELLADVSSCTGHLRILLDNSQSPSFGIPAGSYPLSCRMITFDAITPGSITVDFNTGVFFTGDTISVFTQSNCTINWNGASANGLLGQIGRSFLYKAVGIGNFTASGALGPMFDLENHSMVDLRGAVDGTFGGVAVELFDIAATKSCFVYLGDRQVISDSGFIRGLGGAEFIYRSSSIPSNIYQPNVITLSLKDLDGLTQIIPSGTSASLNTLTRLVLLDSASAFTLNLSALAVGQRVRIIRRSTATTFVYVTAGMSDSINGVSFSGSSWALPCCAVPMTAGSRQVWDITRTTTSQLECQYLGPQGVGVLPQTGTGLVGAYDFDGSFNDTSGNGNNLTAVGTTPLYEGDYAKGRQVVLIGAGALSSTAAALRGILDEYYEIVIEGNAGAGAQWFHSTDALGTRKSYFGINSGFAFFGFDDTGGTLRDVVSNRVIRGTGLYLIQAKRVVSGGNSTLTIWENGVQTVTGVKTAQTPNNSGVNNTFYLGQNSSGTERLGSSTRPARVSQYRVWQGTVPTNAEIVNRARAIGLYLPAMK